LFAAFTIFLFILFSLKKIKRITVKGFVASFLAFVAVIVGLIIITEAKIDVGNYFSYTASRMEKLFVGDNSVSARIKLINESLHAINSNAFLGSGISSSEKILGADYAHNMILETWLESGIVNATLLTMILLYGGVIAVKIMRRSHQGMFVGLAYIYLALSHMKSFSVTDSRVLVFFYGTVIAMSLCSDRALAKDH